MTDIEGKAVKGNSERVWETNEFQSRKLQRELATAVCLTLLVAVQVSRFFGALPEFFRSWAKFSFSRDDADRKWLRLRSEVQKFYSVSETVTKVYRNGNAAPRFDGRHDAGHAVMFLDDARFLFHLRKDGRQ